MSNSNISFISDYFNQRGVGGRWMFGAEEYCSLFNTFSAKEIFHMSTVRIFLPKGDIGYEWS